MGRRPPQTQCISFGVHSPGITAENAILFPSGDQRGKVALIGGEAELKPLTAIHFAPPQITLRKSHVGHPLSIPGKIQMLCRDIREDSFQISVSLRRNVRVRRAASHRPRRFGGRPGLEPDTRNPLVHWSTASARIWIASRQARELPRFWFSSLLKIGRRNISHPPSNCHNTGRQARSIPAKMDEGFRHRLTLPKLRSRKSLGLEWQSATGSLQATNAGCMPCSPRSQACGLRSHRFRPDTILSRRRKRSFFRRASRRPHDPK